MVSRFINADVFASTGQGLLGYNVFIYCNNAPIVGIDEQGTCFRFVGIGAEFELTIGSYTVGIEVIIYLDDTVCGGDEPVVAVYVYEGVGVNMDEVMKNPDYLKIVEQLTLTAATLTIPDNFGKRELMQLQAQLFKDVSVSVAVVGVFGYDNFKSPSSYEGGFQTRSVSYKHVKAGYAYSDTGFAIVIGATTQSAFHISIGATNYSLITQ